MTTGAVADTKSQSARILLLKYNSRFIGTTERSAIPADAACKRFLRGNVDKDDEIEAASQFLPLKKCSITDHDSVGRSLQRQFSKGTSGFRSNIWVRYMRTPSGPNGSNIKLAIARQSRASSAKLVSPAAARPSLLFCRDDQSLGSPQEYAAQSLGSYFEESSLFFLQCRGAETMKRARQEQYEIKELCLRQRSGPADTVIARQAVGGNGQICAGSATPKIGQGSMWKTSCGQL